MTRCMIAPIGNAFMEGCKEQLIATADDLRRNGYETKIEGVPDICVTPFHGLGAMRNIVIISALLWGADYILIVDNDIRLSDPTVARRLISHNLSIVTPWFDQRPFASKDGIWHVIQNPMPEPRHGLLKIEWVAVNCILFATKVFQVIDPRLFTDPMIVNEEEYLFSYLKWKGFELWQDTDSIVEMLRPPTAFWKLIPGGKNPNPFVGQYRQRELQL